MEVDFNLPRLGGEFASDELFMLNFTEKAVSADWILIKTEGPTPGKRYGHSMNSIGSYIIVFGGFVESGPVNDTWLLYVKKMPFKWQELRLQKSPVARAYHTGAVGSSRETAAAVFIFGGRNADQQALADPWKLKKIENGQWEWIQMPNKGSVDPTPRFQVTRTNTNSTPPYLRTTGTSWREEGELTSMCPSLRKCTIPAVAFGNA